MRLWPNNRPCSSRKTSTTPTFQREKVEYQRVDGSWSKVQLYSSDFSSCENILACYEHFHEKAQRTWLEWPNSFREVARIASTSSTYYLDQCCGGRSEQFSSSNILLGMECLKRFHVEGTYRLSMVDRKRQCEWTLLYSNDAATPTTTIVGICIETYRSRERI